MSCRMTQRNTCIFSVWAPEKNSMILHLTGSGTDRKIAMKKNHRGYFTLELDGFRHDDRYFFIPGDGPDCPDPASHFQPEGVHGPSAIVDHSQYAWQDGSFRGLPFDELILYELHVGTFSAQGSFAAIIPFLDDLAAIGVNAIELMPVAQFPGGRNWGYDGVFPYAVQNTYGGPNGLKELVDACHRRGLSVFLDVVYNHLGPEGNYFSFFGPYFTDQYHTPWGPAMNFDGKWCDGVREFFIQNALHWFENYHIDGLRLDAIHEVYDRSAIHIWEEMHREVKRLEQRSCRPLHLVAESDLNSPRVVRPPGLGGYGFDAQWLDDFHHILYVLLDKEGISHYRDFYRPEQLVKAYADGFVHSGEWVDFRRRKHGASSAGISGKHFIVFNQNHDLPGNRPGGERLSTLVDLARQKLAAAALLMAPYVPLLFMGEEYGEKNPFYFFSDYGDKELAQKLREGRKQQFAAFDWDQDPPDSQDPDVFIRSKLKWDRRGEGDHAELLEWYTQLIRLRKSDPLLKDLSKNHFQANLLGGSALALVRYDTEGLRGLCGLFNFSDQPLVFVFSYGGRVAEGSMDRAAGAWIKLLDSGNSSLPATITVGQEISLPPLVAAIYLLAGPLPE
jgi:maltooligosyltrehalose trehalohydrolase